MKHLTLIVILTSAVAFQAACAGDLEDACTAFGEMGIEMAKARDNGLSRNLSEQLMNTVLAGSVKKGKVQPAVAAVSSVMGGMALDTIYELDDTSPEVLGIIVEAKCLRVFEEAGIK